MTADVIARLPSLLEQLEGWRGTYIEIVEQLTRSPGSLDRHVATRSVMRMRLEHVGVAFSGATLMLSGRVENRDVEYQVACDLLHTISLTESAIALIERFGTAAERHTTCRPE